MIARLSLLALCVTLAVTPVLAKDKSAAPAATPAAANAVACDGVFGPQSSEALLIQTYGAENVVTGQVPGAEGMDMLATTVFPNDPDKTMQFGWWDEENLSILNFVDLAPSQIGPLGVQIGMTPAEVEAINGKGFMIGGFWWDYGGYANIDSGKLVDLPGGCYLSLRFSPEAEYPADLDVSAVSGEVQVPSDEPLLDELDTRVQVVSLSYPGDEGAE